MSKLRSTENRTLEEWQRSREHEWKKYDDRVNEGISHESERDVLFSLAEHLDRMIDYLLQTIRKLDN